ncbi:MAG: class I SAM-dependent methyltransferase [Acidobacteria bacterium]|nr:class I SAM-dependent methyltransferase [Acidobacteriota bacterium]
MPVPERALFDEPLNGCLLCDSDRIRLFAVDFQDRQIFRCRECDITFLNPQYSDEYLRKLYDRYPGIHFPGAGKNTPLDQRMRREVHDYYFSLVERFVRPGRLLAVGCGDGLEMSIARDRGWTVKGCDIDEKAISRVRSHGFEVFHGSLEEIPFTSSRYDCVYLHHVLEHPKSPQTYIRKAAEILDASGVLFIASPNLGSLSSRLKTFLSQVQTEKEEHEALRHLAPPVLLHPFRAETAAGDVLRVSGPARPLRAR